MYSRHSYDWKLFQDLNGKTFLPSNCENMREKKLVSKPLSRISSLSLLHLLLTWLSYVMRCVIWYICKILKKVKNTHGGVLILVKLQA